MVNPLTSNPHIYKKGRILKFKKLNEGIDAARSYIFSKETGTLKGINDQCNNLNQIIARTLLGTYKLLSYFGLSKDPSDSHSREPSVFNHFEKLFQKGGDNKNLEEIKTLLKIQVSKIEKLETEIEKLKRPEGEKPINRNEVLDFTERLKAIQNKLEMVIG